MLGRRCRIVKVNDYENKRSLPLLNSVAANHRLQFTAIRHLSGSNLHPGILFGLHCLLLDVDDRSSLVCLRLASLTIAHLCSRTAWLTSQLAFFWSGVTLAEVIEIGLRTMINSTFEHKTSNLPMLIWFWRSEHCRANILNIVNATSIHPIRCTHTS